ANAVVLPYVLDWYGPAARKRLAQLAEAAGVCEPNTSDAEKAAAFITAIREMNRRMHIPERFECIREEDIPLMAKRAVKECNPLYPVPKIMRRAGCETLIRMLQS
ncbi:MAG: iron-containing alcohol dehydrogenase, partial [Firmicutes bacterium]|nr:iron-containing alcohol dehydrogenase [Bacillota bacterium]